MKNRIGILVVSSILCIAGKVGAQVTDPVLMEIDGKPVTKVSFSKFI